MRAALENRAGSSGERARRSCASRARDRGANVPPVTSPDASTERCHVILQDRLTGALLGVVPLATAAGAALVAAREVEIEGALVHASAVHEVADGLLLALVEEPLVLRGGAAGAALPFLNELEAVIEARRASTAQKSYTRSLLDGGAEKVGRKLREEADELAKAVADEADERVASEAADVVFHLLVGLRLRDVPWRSVIEVLARRFGTSGHEEKASRKAAAEAPR